MGQENRSACTDTLRVLVIDDHALVASAVATILAATPDIAIVAEMHSFAALEKHLLAAAGTEPPHVAVVDYYLGKGTAIDVANLLAHACPTTNVVVVSAHSTWEQLRSAVAAGCLGFVNKTDGIASLVLAVRAAAKGESTIDIAASLPHPRSSDAGGDARRLGSLTPRERQVLQLVADGRADDTIAAELNLSLHTVRNHLAKILLKLHVHSRLAAVSLATYFGIVTISATTSSATTHEL
jgi:DNA-binding NarL/FixJ family response regulator